MRLQSHCEQEPDLLLCVLTRQLQAWKDSKQTGDASSSPLTSGHMPRSLYSNLGYARTNVTILQDFDLTGPNGSLLSQGSVAIGAVF